MFGESHSLKSASTFFSAETGAADLAFAGTGAGAASAKCEQIAKQLKDNEMQIFDRSSCLVKAGAVGVNLCLGC